MTIEQFFRSQPAENAIVVCARDGTTRILEGAEFFRGFDARRGKPLTPGKLLRDLIAQRRDGKKK